MATELAQQKAAQGWCTDKTSNIVMDTNLAEAFADILDGYIGALTWASGSADFLPHGKARRGWLKTCRPLLR